MDLAHLATSTAQVFRNKESTLGSLSDADLTLRASTTDADADAIDCILVVPITSTSAAVRAVVDDDSFAEAVFSMYKAGIAKAAETAAYDDAAGDAAVAAAAAALAVGRTFALILGGNTSDALTVSIAALAAANVDSLASDYLAPDAAVLVAAVDTAVHVNLVDSAAIAAATAAHTAAQKVHALLVAGGDSNTTAAELSGLMATLASALAVERANGLALDVSELRSAADAVLRVVNDQTLDDDGDDAVDLPTLVTHATAAVATLAALETLVNDARDDAQVIDKAAELLAAASAATSAAGGSAAALNDAVAALTTNLAEANRVSNQQTALSLGSLAVLVDAVLAAATEVVEAVKDEVAVLALANAQDEVNRRRLRKISLATVTKAAKDEAEGRRLQNGDPLADVNPGAMLAALANVSNQIHSLGNATESSGNEADVIEIAKGITAAAALVATELPANSEDAAGLMELVKTAEVTGAASDALLGSVAFVDSEEFEEVTTTTVVTPSVEGTTRGEFPPASPPRTPPAAPPPPGGSLLEPAGEDGNTVAEVDGPLVAIIVMLNVLFLLLVVLPVGYALHTYPGKASIWLRLKTTHSNVRSSPYYL